MCHKNERERKRNSRLIVQMTGNTTLLANPDRPGEKPRKFTFDHSFWSHDGFKSAPNGYHEAKDPRYTDQVNPSIQCFLLFPNVDLGGIILFLERTF